MTSDCSLAPSTQELLASTLHERVVAPPLSTRRLLLKPLEESDLSSFHELAKDDYVRRYLMDGRVVTRAWASDQVKQSSNAFRAFGTGLWLARSRLDPSTAVGFGGFMALPENALGPELVYAVLERFAGRGLGSELAEAVVRDARERAHLGRVVASVDAVNAYSVRILQKLGFERIETRRGAFGDLWIYASSAPSG
jgi:[ribosomal protein S5]-alanine N-acetyltransferase